jgi:methyltransferase
MTAGAIFVLVFVSMIVEAKISARNEARLRTRGAHEPLHDVFALMQVGYPAAFLVMILEALWRQPGITTTSAAGFGLFLAAKVLKYWVIATLGERWTFRVLVPPASTRIVSGPYRFVRHPNYMAVIGELVAVALMTRAIVTGVPATVLFALLIRKRIAVEERALGMRGVESPS